MTRKIRFVHMGLGPMGAKVCKQALTREGVEIVGAIEQVNLGQDVGEVLGLDKKLGVTLTDDVKKALSTKPDIVLTDWVMPPHNGIDLARWVRTGAGSPDPFLPIIMMTAFSDLDRVAEARDAGVNEFLAKPMSPKNLMRRVQAVVEKPRSYIRNDGYFGPERRRRELPYIGDDRRDDGMGHTREDSKLRKATGKSK